MGVYSLVDHIQPVPVLVLNNCKNWLNVSLKPLSHCTKSLFSWIDGVFSAERVVPAFHPGLRDPTSDLGNLRLDSPAIKRFPTSSWRIYPMKRTPQPDLKTEQKLWSTSIKSVFLLTKEKSTDNYAFFEVRHTREIPPIRG